MSAVLWVTMAHLELPVCNTTVLIPLLGIGEDVVAYKSYMITEIGIPKRECFGNDV